MMKKDLLNIFILETKIDDNLIKATKIVNTIHNHFNNKWDSDLEDEDITDMLDEAEYDIKVAKDLLDKIVEEYEKYYSK